jgi:hypothetical protein
MLIKRANKERDFYRIANRGLPDLQEDVEDAAVFWLGSSIRVTCTEHYPFRPPTVHVIRNHDIVPYKSLLSKIRLKDDDAFLMCQMIRPELFESDKWPDIDQCPCCTSAVCDSNWTLRTHVHDIAAECVFWLTYVECHDLLSSTLLRELPRDVLQHIVHIHK